MSATLELDDLVKPLPFWSPRPGTTPPRADRPVGRLSKASASASTAASIGRHARLCPREPPRARAASAAPSTACSSTRPAGAASARGRLLEEKIAGAVRAGRRGAGGPPRRPRSRRRPLRPRALKSVGDAVPVAAVLRDYRRENIDKAAANAAALGLDVAVEQADASPPPAARLAGRRRGGLRPPRDRARRRQVEAHFGQVASILAPGGRFFTVSRIIPSSVHRPGAPLPYRQAVGDAAPSARDDAAWTGPPDSSRVGRHGALGIFGVVWRGRRADPMATLHGLAALPGAPAARRAARPPA